MIRFFDIVIALLALSLLLPIYLLIAIAVFLDIGNPVFFLQERVGLGGKTFSIIKFRSMKNIPLSDDNLEKVNEYTIKVKKDPRISTVGAFIRKTSLDELPQLVNVLIGNMSLVGPRPFVLAEYEQFPKEWHYRLKAKPGITGLAQIRGRSDLPMAQIIASDIEWIDKQNVWSYFFVLFKTAIFLFRMKNVY